MTDRDMEDLLRRVRPAGPRPALRARILAGTAASVRKPAWPWGLAAAALFALTATLQFSTARMDRDTARIVAPPDSNADDRPELRDALDGDESLMRRAALWTSEARRNGPRAESEPR
jgi:hypothetical protein